MRMFGLYFSKRWSFSLPGYLLDVAWTVWIVPVELVPKAFCIGFPRDSTPLWDSNDRDPTHLWYSFHNSYSTLVVAFSVLKALSLLFTWLFFNVAVWKQTLVPCFASRFSSMELTFGRMPIHTRRTRTSTFQIVSARLSRKSASLTSASGASFSRRTSTSCHWWLRGWSGFWSRFWCTIITLMPETTLVTFRTLAFFLPPVTSTFSSFNATQSLTTLDRCSCFIFPCLASKFRNRSFWSFFLFTMVFNFWLSNLSSMFFLT